MPFSRRDFVKTSVLGAVAAGVGAPAQGEDAKQADPRTRSSLRIVQAPHHHLRQQRLQLSRRRLRLPEKRRRHARRRSQSGQGTRRRSQRHQRRPRRTSQRRRRGRTRCLLHARPHAPRWLCRRSAQHQERVARLESGVRAYRTRHARRRRRRALRRSRRLPAREPAHRALPQGLVAVERSSTPTKTGGDQASPTRTGSLPTQIPTNHNRNYGKSASRTFKPAPPNSASSPSCK